ncbi:MAG: hypothetical protein OEY03_05105 [Rhizobacter sp.]|nr:hypothetical protein [Rhizobacter sp.]
MTTLPTAPPTTPAELQADTLVAEIERQVAQRRRELLKVGRAEVAEIRERAREKARRQMRRAIDEMRATQRQRTRQVQAELETAQRRQASQRAIDLLGATLPRLAEALARRWNEPAARARWIDAQIDQARERLVAHDWVVRHPAGWSDAELDALRAALQAHGVAAVELQADAGIEIGLVIDAGGARLDSTPAALLADPGRVASALLAAVGLGAEPSR